MIVELRRRIASGLALLITVLTLGTVHVNWTGRPTAAARDDDVRAPVSDATPPRADR